MQRQQTTPARGAGEVLSRIFNTGKPVNAGFRLFSGAARGSLWGVLLLSVVIVIGLKAEFSTTTAGFLFLLCVIFQSLRGDFWSAAIVSTVAAFALAFFFTPPPYSFAIPNSLEAIAVLTFVITAFVIAHSVAFYPARGMHALGEEPANIGISGESIAASQRRRVALLKSASGAVVIGAFLILVYGLGWNYSTKRYLKGFADAIIPLSGSPEEKTEALVEWFHHEPGRINFHVTEPAGEMYERDPVSIVQNARLLGVCGTSSNAFMNLAIAAELKVRRVLLLDRFGNVMHVVAEVQWGDRWVVVNPQQGLVFKDKRGHGLTKEELRDPEVFQDAISRMPGYDPRYIFQRTIHLHIERIPIMGRALRRGLDRFAPGWEEATNWAYFPENPSLWLIFISIPLFLVGILANLMVSRYGRDRRATKSMESPQ